MKIDILNQPNEVSDYAMLLIINEENKISEENKILYPNLFNQYNQIILILKRDLIN